MEKHTPTDYNISELITNRWSPRAFSSEPISDADLKRLFEAVRWSASSMNEQPWSFVYVRKGTPEFENAAPTIMEGNAWALEAPMIIFTLVKTHFVRNGNLNRTAFHDLGLAVGNLSLQATSMDIYLHQMGGIFPEKAQELLNVPEGYEVVTAIALGKAGDPESLQEPLKSRELAERNRKPQSEFVFEGVFQSS